MARQHIDVEQTTPAPPEAVFALLSDSATWPDWTPLDSFELEREGAQTRQGVGAIRVFRNGRRTMREEIVEVVPDRRFSYTLLSGLAIRGYRADVDLEPAGAGTRIRWRSSFAPKVPGTGWLYRRALGQATEAFVRGLAEHAAKGSSATAA